MPAARPTSRLPSAGARAQRGISLLFALMALVIMGFGAVALTRSVDTGTLIMGNLSFQQDAVMSSSSAAEQAMVWLDANKSGVSLDNDVANKGYYASHVDALDVAGNRTSAAKKLPIVNWDGNCLGMTTATYDTCVIVPFRGADVNGNVVQWVIMRLCDATGPATGGSNLCVRPATSSTTTAKERGELQPGGRLSGAMASPYYRIIVRVQGPRNTTSYTESIVHF
ncbi:MAG: hypothetical protein JWP65_3758 [Ramlibacter sp.]|jgi:type IV pilus assembly protein PilX|uniref:pilus assembly PilX family protein n=1 Tax=Ramlibacter sp. TaxID=1917967 RepID=UPI002626DD03|nr:hypothetical protein [Ramlibacter sp.]MDB5753337.1 hypothetical protein [Ramlibacter sp.]